MWHIFKKKHQYFNLVNVLVFVHSKIHSGICSINWTETKQNKIIIYSRLHIFQIIYSKTTITWSLCTWRKLFFSISCCTGNNWKTTSIPVRRRDPKPNRDCNCICRSRPWRSRRRRQPKEDRAGSCMCLPPRRSD